jgi:hypothetical protein
METPRLYSILLGYKTNPKLSSEIERTWGTPRIIFCRYYEREKSRIFYAVTVFFHYKYTVENPNNLLLLGYGGNPKPSSAAATNIQKTTKIILSLLGHRKSRTLSSVAARIQEITQTIFCYYYYRVKTQNNFCRC